MKKKVIFIIGIVVMFLVIVFLLPWQDAQHGRAKTVLPVENTPPLKADRLKTSSPASSAEHTEKKTTVYRIGNGITYTGHVLEIDHGLRPVDILNGEKVPQAIRNAQNHGALAAVTFLVVDDQGVPVPDAVVSGGFWNHGKKGFGFEKQTDDEGMVALQDRCVGDINFIIAKDGYYLTSLCYNFLKGYYDCVQDGRWIPWNPTIEVVLKKKRNPIPMYVKKLDIMLPKKSEVFGFDFQVGDLVEPHGKGKHADVLLSCARDLPFEFPKTFSRYLTLSFNRENEGIIRRDKDSYSAFLSLYEAPENGYQPEISFCYQRINDKVIERNELGGAEYLLLRTRVEMNNGGISKAHYAKIYSLGFGVSGDENEGGRVSIVYYFNPNENDRNLEFDGMNNLMKIEKGKTWFMQP